VGAVAHRAAGAVANRAVGAVPNCAVGTSAAVVHAGAAVAGEER